MMKWNEYVACNIAEEATIRERHLDNIDKANKVIFVLTVLVIIVYIGVKG